MALSPACGKPPCAPFPRIYTKDVLREHLEQLETLARNAPGTQLGGIAPDAVYGEL